MAVVLEFNQVEVATFNDLLTRTQLAHFDLEKVLLALTAREHPILKVKAREVTQRATFCGSDAFILNSAWAVGNPTKKKQQI